MTKERPVQLAIVGCGAIAERGHLPAATACGDIEVTVLVDKDIARAQRLAGEFRVAHVTEDYRQLSDYASAAVVALPPHLHAPVTIDLLNRGIHVLVEKPMAMLPGDCDRMIDAGHKTGSVLTVGLVRRYRRTWKFAKHVIDHQLLGRIESFEVREGDAFGWPVATPFFLSKEEAGGGVLADAGVHVLDALLWWFGDVESLQYRDDDYGGVESDCELDLVMAGGVKGRVRLTRTHATPNSTVIYGERGSLTIEAYTNHVHLEMKANADGERFALGAELAHSHSGVFDACDENVRADQLADFAHAIRTGRPPAVDGEQGRRSVELVGACYAQRRPLNFPWVHEGVEAHEAPGHEQTSHVRVDSNGGEP